MAHFPRLYTLNYYHKKLHDSIPQKTKVYVLKHLLVTFGLLATEMVPVLTDRSHLGFGRKRHCTNLCDFEVYDASGLSPRT